MISSYHPIVPEERLPYHQSLFFLIPYPISLRKVSKITLGWYADPPISHPTLQSAYYYLGLLECLYLRIYFPIISIPLLQYSSFSSFCTWENRSMAVRKKVSSAFPPGADGGVNSPSFFRPCSPLFADCRIRICHNYTSSLPKHYPSKPCCLISYTPLSEVT
jgi:hypothetical protein